MDREASRKAELLLATAYEEMGLAHRWRAAAIDCQEEGKEQEDIFYAHAEWMFDEAEKDIEKAFEIEDVCIARYTVDGRKLLVLLDEIYDQVITAQDDLRAMDMGTVAMRLAIIKIKCREGLGRDDV